MLSGGPNWELQANVILYWQGLQCQVVDLIWKNLCAKKIFAGDYLGGVGGGLTILIIKKIILELQCLTILSGGSH